MTLVYVGPIKGSYMPPKCFNPDSRSSLKKLAEYVFDFYLEPATARREDDQQYIAILRGELERVVDRLRTECGARFYEIVVEE